MQGSYQSTRDIRGKKGNIRPIAENTHSPHLNMFKNIVTISSKYQLTEH